jgi:hypothetical protein
MKVMVDNSTNISITNNYLSYPHTQNKRKGQRHSRLEIQVMAWIRVIVFNATFNNFSVISWPSVLLLLVEENGESGENHRPAASYLETLSHNIVSSTPRHKRGSNSQG